MQRPSFIIVLLLSAALLAGGTASSRAAEQKPPVKERAAKKPAAPAKKPARAAKAPVAIPVSATAPAPIATSIPVRKSAAAKKAAAADDENTPPPAADVNEELALPDYPAFARIGTGTMETYVAGEEDTLLDVARKFHLGYVEIRAANPDIDPWAPGPGAEVVIPSFHLLPRAPQDGIVVNLAEMRLYYFRKPGSPPETFPIGIGKDGLMTPVGETSVLRKVAGPTWHPTPRMRTEKPYLPASVPQGPANPLGTHALYLGWPTFLIHGSNKPWAIGRRVSSGCMRMYPEDIRALFDLVPVGTKVTVVEQPLLVGWVDDVLYLEAHPSRIQSNELEIEGAFMPKEVTEGVRKTIRDAAGPAAANAIDWETAEKILRERRGYPVEIARIATAPHAKPAPRPAAKQANKARTKEFN